MDVSLVAMAQDRDLLVADAVWADWQHRWYALAVSCGRHEKRASMVSTASKPELPVYRKHCTAIRAICITIYPLGRELCTGGSKKILCVYPYSSRQQ